MVLYALVTTHCNLSCPHCNVKSSKENFNEDLFIDRLNSFNGHIILFGGEPTLYQDRLMKVANDELLSNKSVSITTNLLNLNNELIQLYHKLDSVGTSWNPARFDYYQYINWLHNVELLRKEGFNLTVLVTLSPDLMAIEPQVFMNIIQDWKVSSIKFEHYIGDDVTEEYMNMVDEWLCEVYKLWNVDIRNDIADKVNDWNFDCSNVYTLHPEGNITLGCPHTSDIFMPTECYSCERSISCRPCKLQKYCSFPKKLAKLVNERSN